MSDSSRHPLATWIERKGLKQTEAAQKLGISEPYLSQILSGKKCGVSVKTGRRLARVTGIDLEEFLAPAEAAE